MITVEIHANCIGLNLFSRTVIPPVQLVWSAIDAKCRMNVSDQTRAPKVDLPCQPDINSDPEFIVI